MTTATPTTTTATLDLLSYTPTTTPPYPLLFPLTPIESSYNLPFWRSYLQSNWHLTIPISLLYIFLIFFGQLWMKNRPPFSLRKILAVWNFCLAVFSIGGTIRTWPELFYILGNGGGGIRGSICSRDHHNAGSAFWGLLFTLSKAVELGDTAFIVLRKQPLIFLHWYHHISVLGYTWYTYHTYDSTSRWFMVMNYPVHALMYSYYGLKSLRLAVPKPISMLITILQLSQMVIGVIVNIYALLIINSGGACQVEVKHIHLALVMYFSYFLLFCNFFYNAYLEKVRRRSSSLGIVEKKIISSGGGGGGGGRDAKKNDNNAIGGGGDNVLLMEENNKKMIKNSSNKNNKKEN